MKNTTMLYVLALLSVITGNCRTPENLAGTDLFPAEVVVQGQVRLSKDDIRIVPVSLPTKVLNLAYGAEFFTCGLQPLYQFGEIVELRVKGSFEERAAATREGRLPTYKQFFYNTIVRKDVLLYKQCNPLALLARMLFWQIPGSRGLSDLHVAQACLVKNADGKTVNMQATMQAWADFIAYALSLYMPITCAQARARFNGQDALAIKAENVPFEPRIIEPFTTAWGTFKVKDGADREGNIELDALDAIKLHTVLIDSILWAERNNFGRDCVVRILMAGVYALIGHDQSLIFQFYQKLSAALAPVLKDANPVLALPELDALPAQFTATSNDDGALDGNEAYTAYRCLKNVRGGFDPLVYASAEVDEMVFTDCFETMMRNIVLALLLQRDGTFNTDIAHADVNAFLVSYPSMSAQATGAARNAWAALVSKRPGALYVKNGEYEQRSSLINMLFMLNYLFALNIDALNEHVVSIAVDDGPANAAFIGTVLPLVNAALYQKLSRSDDLPIITLAGTVHDTLSSSIRYTVNAENFSFDGSIDVGQHCSILEITHNAETAYVQAGPFSLLERAQLKVPDAAAGWSNIALLKQGMTVQQANDYVRHLHGNLVMLRMLFVLAANSYYDDRRMFFDYMQLFAINNLFAHESISAAYDGIQRVDADEVSQGLVLFKQLVSVRQAAAFAPATKAACDGIQHSDKQVRADSYALMKELIDKGEALAEAIPIATEALQSNDALTRGRALQLFKKLFDQKVAFSDAEKAIAACRASDNQAIQQNANNLERALTEARNTASSSDDGAL